MVQPKMQRRPRILIVDDHRDNIDLLAQFLRGEEYTLAYATGGAEALDIVKRSPPDLILLDVMMPDIDGLDVTRRIKADQSLPFIPIILITAKSDLSDKVTGLDAGADDYLGKPVQTRELQAKVRAFLRLKQAQDALMDERNKLDLLNKIQQQLTSSLDVDQVVRDTIIMMVRVLDAAQGSVIVAEGRHGDMWRKILAQRDRDEREESFVTSKVIDEGLAGVAIRTGEPQILHDTETDDRWIRHTDDLSTVRSALAVPLIHHETILGVLTLTHPEVDHFREDQLPLVTAAAGQISTALNNARLFGQLKEAETAREEFLNMLTHDLRGPLAGIAGCLHVLSLAPQSEEHIFFIDLARAACKTQEQLIDDILDVYRAEAGHMELEYSDINLREVGEEVLQNLTGAAAERNLTMKVDLPDGLHVRADRDKLTRVLTNLLSNAVKFTRTGGVYVTADVDEFPGFICIRVRDTGQGISESDLEHIFDRFYQAQRRGDRRGTGLGLAFSREVVNAHGGRIWAESQMGQGTTFALTLPLDREAA